MPNSVTVKLDGGQVKLAIGKDLSALAANTLLLLIFIDPKLEWLDVFDYSLGSLYELACAEALQYEDRHHAYEPSEYLSSSLVPRARDMSVGWLRLEGKWAAGLHFKSALMRMDAVHERAEELLGLKKKGGKQRSTAGQPPPWCGKRHEHKHLAMVYQDVGRFKHTRSGTAEGHEVRFEDAIAAFRELVGLLDLAK